MNSEHGIVVVWIMLRVGFICSDYCWRWRQNIIGHGISLNNSLKQVECQLGISWPTESIPVITQRRALGTLNILNSKWTVAMNFIKKIPFHFNISWNCQNKWSGFHGHRAAEQVLPLFQHLTALVGAQVAWDITFCSGCLSEWFQSHHGREDWATEKVNVCMCYVL